MSITIESTTSSKSAGTANGGLASEAAEDKPASGEAADETAEASGASEDTEDGEDSKAEEHEDSESDEDEGSEKDGKPKRKSGFKRRVEKLSKRLSAAQQEADYWRQEALKKANASKNHEPADAIKADTSDKPRSDQFDTHEEYVEALANWKYDQRQKADELKRREHEAKTEFQKQYDAHVKRVEAFKKAHDDFEDVIEDVSDIDMSVTVRDAILSSDNGPELMYELAKNPAEFERICQLPAIAAARAIGRIEAKLATSSEAKEVKTSKAPKPISPVNAKSGSVVKSIYDPGLSFADYERLRREQLKSKR